MFVALPIEIAVRELDAQIWLAMHLLQNNIPVVLGSKDGVENVCKTLQEPFVMIDKGFASYLVEKYKRIVMQGGYLVELHAEGLGCIQASSYSVDVLGEAEKYFDASFVWGKSQASIIKRRLSDTCSMHVIPTGHPSFDLVHPRFRHIYADKSLKKVYGKDFILVNSCNGTLFAKVAFDDYKKMMPNSVSFNEQGRKIHDTYLDRERSYVHHIHELFEGIAQKFPGRIIVYRPHPVEDIDAVCKEFARHGNVRVVHDGSVRAWLVEASVVINWHCTTGYESICLNTPTISFQPPTLQTSEEMAYGKLACSVQEVLELINCFDSGGWTQEVRDTLLATWKNVLENTKKFAAPHICSWIIENYAEKLQHNFATASMPKRVSFTHVCKQFVRKQVSPLLALRSPEARIKEKLFYTKVPYNSISEQIVSKKIQAFSTCMETAPQVSVYPVFLNTLYLHPQMDFKK